MKCTKCKNEIPAKRIELGNTECVTCSTTEAYSCVDIVYHKTGNTIQIMDKETADAINKASRRSGFGVMRGMLSGKSNKENYDNIKISKVEPFVMPTEEDFNKIGAEAMDILECDGFEAANQFVYKSSRNNLISIRQSYKLLGILKAISDQDKPKQPEKINYNRFGRYEPPKQKPAVSEDISWIFNNWKR